MIHLLYGYGRGKTSSAFGLTLRMVGHGKRVLVVQFIKDGTSGEVAAIRRQPGVDVLHPEPYLDLEANRTLWQEAASHLRDPDGYAMIVLDEVLDAMAGGAMTADELTKAVRAFAATGAELVLTGHEDPPLELADLADYITRFEPVRHPYDRGIVAREGVEY